MASQVVAGFGIEDAGAQEGGADQDVENVEHGEFPRQQQSRRMRRACCGAQELVLAPYRIDGM